MLLSWSVILMHASTAFHQGDSTNFSEKCGATKALSTCPIQIAIHLGGVLHSPARIGGAILLLAGQTTGEG
jgi:hypothetical protein